MRLHKLPPSRPIAGLLLSLCLVTGAVAGARPAPSHPGDVGNVPPPPLPASCWTITGPFNDGKETFFEASNKCDTPRHCQVWVNGHEPPSMVHLEAGASGRIDVGGTEPGDKFSQDCVPIGVYGEHSD